MFGINKKQGIKIEVGDIEVKDDLLMNIMKDLGEKVAEDSCEIKIPPVTKEVLEMESESRKKYIIARAEIDGKVRRIEYKFLVTPSYQKNSGRVTEIEILRRGNGLIAYDQVSDLVVRLNQNEEVEFVFDNEVEALMKANEILVNNSKKSIKSKKK